LQFATPLAALIALPDQKFTNPPRIAIIGGGITGLAAAHRLTELLPHAKLTIFEAAPRLGGLLETVNREGFLIERSADNFLTKSPIAVDLCRRLGIADDLLPTDDARRRALVVRAGRLVPIPDGFYLMAPRRLGSVLTSPILSVVGKIRLLAEPLVPRGPAASRGHSSTRLDADASPPSASDESVASFARRRLGQETFERIVQPLVAGIYTADAEKLSMAATMPDFLDQERNEGRLVRWFRTPKPVAAEQRTARASDQSDTAAGARYGLFAAPKLGMNSLVTALADRLQTHSIRLNAQVVSIVRSPEGNWQLKLSTSTPEGSEGIVSFDAVLVAVPSHAAARLLQPCAARLAAELAAIEYASSAVVSLGFNREQISHPLNGFGFVVPQTENRRIIAASFASQKFPGRAPEGAVLIRTFIGGAIQADLLELSDDELCELAIEELRDLLQITGDPLVVDITRWPLAMPQYHVGHLARVARIEQHESSHANLALAGSAYHGVGIPQCIASGEAAAQRIAANFGTPIP
jgi:protoporphyrinogen/coproporphyrinogen III oxidase